MTLPPQTEAAFQRQVIWLATLYRWKVYHTFDSRRSQAGFPDLVLCKPGVGVLFVELKSDAGRVRPEQAAWLADLTGAGADARVWRPSQWPEIEAALRRETRRDTRGDA